MTNDSSKPIKRVGVKMLETVSIWHREITTKLGEIRDVLGAVVPAKTKGEVTSPMAEQSFMVRLPHGRYPTIDRNQFLRATHCVEVSVDIAWTKTAPVTVPIYMMTEEKKVA